MTLPNKTPDSNSNYAVAKRQEIRKYLPKALDALVRCLDSENERIVLDASRLIIEHSIGKPPAHIDDTGTSANRADEMSKSWAALFETHDISITPRRNKTIEYNDEGTVILES